MVGVGMEVRRMGSCRNKQRDYEKGGIVSLASFNNALWYAVALHFMVIDIDGLLGSTVMDHWTLTLIGKVTSNL